MDLFGVADDLTFDFAQVLELVETASGHNSALAAVANAFMAALPRSSGL